MNLKNKEGVSICECLISLPVFSARIVPDGDDVQHDLHGRQTPQPRTGRGLQERYVRLYHI